MRKPSKYIVLLAAALALAACKRTPVQDGVAVDDASVNGQGLDGASATGLGADGSSLGTGIDGAGSGVDGDPLSKRVVYFEYEHVIHAVNRKTG